MGSKVAELIFCSVVVGRHFVRRLCLLCHSSLVGDSSFWHLWFPSCLVQADPAVFLLLLHLSCAGGVVSPRSLPLIWTEVGVLIGTRGGTPALVESLLPAFFLPLLLAYNRPSRGGSHGLSPIDLDRVVFLHLLFPPRIPCGQFSVRLLPNSPFYDHRYRSCPSQLRLLPSISSSSRCPWRAQHAQAVVVDPRWSRSLFDN